MKKTLSFIESSLFYSETNFDSLEFSLKEEAKGCFHINLNCHGR